MQRLKRMYGLIVQEFFLTRQSLEIFMDILFYPVMNVALFGFISSFLGKSTEHGVEFLLLGTLLWQVVAINQYNVTISSMWSIWSHNLTNIFIAPVSIGEYLASHILAAFLRTVGVVGVLGLGAYWAFGFNLLDVGWMNLVFFFINLSLFGWWIGIILLGTIFRFGTRIQAVAWGTIFLFQPLTASFFPVSVLPTFLQPVALALPATYVFEAGRQALVQPGVNWSYALIALGMNLAYSALAVLLFQRLFRQSRQTGQFARNDLG